MEEEKKIWEPGIPENYTKDDLIDYKTLYNYGLRHVIHEFTSYKRYKLGPHIDTHQNMKIYTFTRGKKTAYVCFDVAIYPNVPILTDKMRYLLFKYGHKENCDCYFAPIPLRSIDPERAAQSLALKHDSYIISGEHCTKIEFTEEFEDQYKKFAIVDAIGEGYSKKDYSKFEQYIADDCVWSSFWTLNDRKGKTEIDKYYNEKFEKVQGNRVEYLLCYFDSHLSQEMRSKPHEDGSISRAFIYQKTNAPIVIISQQKDDGELINILIDVSFNDELKVKQLTITEPSLFNFSY